MPDSLPPTPPSPQTALDWARFYGGLGWSVVPVRRGEKIPAEKWARFQTLPADGAQLLAWFADNPAFGVGLVQGRRAGTIVLDFDAATGGMETLADLEKQGLPASVRAFTPGGGCHVILRHPGHYVPTRKAVLPGMDVRGDGGFIVACPSIHANGRAYVWDVDCHPEDAPIADAPDWLVAIVTGDAPAQPDQPGEVVRVAAAGPLGLSVERVTDGREQYMRDTILAVCRELRDKLGRLPAEAELFDAAWPQYAAKVDFSRAGRGEPEFRAKVRYTLARIGAGQIRGLTATPDPPAAGHAVTASGVTYDAETGEIIEAPPRAAAAQPAARSFELVWFDDITPCLDAQDFVQGVLIENSAAVVYGESNAGKTFWTTDLALHVAAGKTWNGRRVEQGGVVYCVLEGGVGFRNRVTAWRGTHQPDKPVHFAAIQAGMNLLLPDADTPKLIAAIKEAAERIGAPVKLIVIDTLSRAFAGGNENASEDMGLLVQNMDAIRRETGACVLFVHHSGKDQAKGARGHSLLRAAIDTEIEVKATEDSPVKTATTVKQREVKKGEVFHFQLEVVELGQNRHGEPVTTCVVDAPSAEDIAQAEASGGDRLSGDQAAALRVLTNLLAASGMVSPHPDMPDNVRSVPEAWWADRFKTEAKPGASDEAKRKAFRRSADRLLHIGKIGQANGRVWLV